MLQDIKMKCGNKIGECQWDPSLHRIGGFEDDLTEMYGISIGEQLLIDYEKYRGKGRPRKGDYMTFIEAQKKLNKFKL